MAEALQHRVEDVAIERLAQESRRTPAEVEGFRVFAQFAGDDNDGNGQSRLADTLEQLEAVHHGHFAVGDDAAHLGQDACRQHVCRRQEGARAVAEGSKQVCQRLEYAAVIVDYCNAAVRYRHCGAPPWRTSVRYSCSGPRPNPSAACAPASPGRQTTWREI